jgi:putative Holliday junction resolvase
MRTLALDVGSKTIGLAVSDEDEIVAMAWEVLSRKGHEQDARAVVERVRARGVGRIVVGLPLELDGRRGHRAAQVERFITVLRETLAARPSDPIPIETWDERFSTAAAERVLLEADVSRARRKQKVDALAAQFILQGWLDARHRRAHG